MQEKTALNCSVCLKVIYEPEKLIFHDTEYHKNCFRCTECNCKLDFTNATSLLLMPYCEAHGKKMRKLFFTPNMVKMGKFLVSASQTAMDVLNAQHDITEQREERLVTEEDKLPATPEMKEMSDALSPEEFRTFTFSEIEEITENVRRFRLKLEEGKSLNLPTASAVLLGAPIDEDGGTIVRPYTPITPNSVTGYFDLLIKKYDMGKMSSHMFTLKVGDTIDIKGPFLKYQYPFKKRKIGCVAGGTGLTPVLQCVHEIIENEHDETEISFIYASASPQDILMKEYLDGLAEKHQQFKIQHIVRRAKPEDNWGGPTGYIPREMIEERLPPPGDDMLIFVCGPPSMMRSISGRKGRDRNGKKIQGEVTGLFNELGYTPSMVYKF